MAARESASRVRFDAGANFELVPCLAMLWLVSVVRVGLGLAHGEIFSVEPTLALIAVLLVPFLVKDPLAWYLRRLRAKSRRR